MLNRRADQLTGTFLVGSNHVRLGKKTQTRYKDWAAGIRYVGIYYLSHLYQVKPNYTFIMIRERLTHPLGI
jgi:hypothetical protein